MEKKKFDECLSLTNPAFLNEMRLRRGENCSVCDNKMTMEDIRKAKTYKGFPVHEKCYVEKVTLFDRWDDFDRFKAARKTEPPFPLNLHRKKS